MKFIFLFSFMLQALIPVGFMPAFAKDGTTIVICSGVTGESTDIQVNNFPSGGHEDKDSSQCSYSVMGAYTCVSMPVLAKLDASYILINAELNDIFVKQSVSLSNQSRGPPLISLT